MNSLAPQHPPDATGTCLERFGGTTQPTVSTVAPAASSAARTSAGKGTAWSSARGSASTNSAPFSRARATLRRRPAASWPPRALTPSNDAWQSKTLTTAQRPRGETSRAQASRSPLVKLKHATGRPSCVQRVPAGTTGTGSAFGSPPRRPALPGSSPTTATTQAQKRTIISGREGT